MSLLCKILGHKEIFFLFPPKNPEDILIYCTRCGRFVFVSQLKLQIEEEEEEELRLPPDSHLKNLQRDVV